MLARNKLYERRAPSKEAKLIIIFCEGTKTEPNYFKYFNEISSQIQIIPVPAHPEENNSPSGLYSKACSLLIKSEEILNPKYDIKDNDEIWFVIDTDSWKGKIDELREKCGFHVNWKIAQSNPSFEVWLYYHHFDDIPPSGNNFTSQDWKQYINDAIGGFNPSKHPVFMEKAIDTSKRKFNVDGPNTEVYILAEIILPHVKGELDIALAKINQP